MAPCLKGNIVKVHFISPVIVLYAGIFFVVIKMLKTGSYISDTGFEGVLFELPFAQHDINFFSLAEIENTVKVVHSRQGKRIIRFCGGILIPNVGRSVTFLIQAIPLGTDTATDVTQFQLPYPVKQALPLPFG